MRRGPCHGHSRERNGGCQKRLAARVARRDALPMTTLTSPITTRVDETGQAAPRTGLLRELERPGEVFANLGPNWYASIMGTGIVANAAALLPLHSTGLLR